MLPAQDDDKSGRVPYLTTAVRGVLKMKPVLVTCIQKSADKEAEAPFLDMLRCCASHLRLMCRTCRSLMGSRAR